MIEKIKVKKDVISWLIRNSRVFIDLMPSDFRAKVSSWNEIGTNGEDLEIEIGELIKLSKYTKRSITTLLLPSPPKDEIKPKDFRGLKEDGGFSKDAELLFRKANFLLYSVKYLMDALGLGNNKINSITESNHENLPNKDKLIKDTMKKWNITIGFQKEMQDSNEVLEFLIDKIERDSIFVFNFSDFSFSGFSFVNPIKAIFINKVDKTERQIFTLLHEYAHIILNENAACGRLRENEPNVENWCDEFSSSFLIDESEYSKITKPISKEQISSYCKIYKVSRSMILFNFFKRGIVDKYEGEKRPFIRAKKGSRKTNLNKTEKNNRLMSLISENLERSNITYSDANKIKKLAG